MRIVANGLSQACEYGFDESTGAVEGAAQIMTAEKDQIIKLLDDLDVRVTVDEAAMQALRELHRLIWAEAHDPWDAETEKFARDLIPHINMLNKKLRFTK